MRKLASVVQIASCEPIPDTDRLSVAMMEGKGWRVVTGRDEFQPGELALYIEIDAFLPADDERYAFLRDRCLKKFVSKSGQVLREGIRIKTCKLRGVISQGLLLKLEPFCGKEIQCVTRKATPDDVKDENGNPLTAEEFAELEKNGLEVTCMTCNGQPVDDGFDMTEALHVEHYDEVKEQLRPVTGGNPVSADAYGKFPSEYVPKTDEERAQNLTDWFARYKGMTWEVTEKQDGSSCTMIYAPSIDAENPFMVCSRNLRLKPVSESGVVPVLWQMAAKYDVESKLNAYYEQHHEELAIQGELLGPGIQKDRDKFTELEWHVFKVWSITNQQYLLPVQRRNLCCDMMLPHVPVVVAELDVFAHYPDCDALLKYAEGKTMRGNEREGLVFKSTTDPSLSFKAVSNRYLMKQED